MRKLTYGIFIQSLFYFIAVMEPVSLLGTEYYVNPQGNDQNAGTSPTDAWRSIERANRQDFYGNPLPEKCWLSLGACEQPVRLRLDPGHAWIPPFGIDRVGQPITVIVELPAAPKLTSEYWLVGYRKGKEINRRQVIFPESSTKAARVNF